MNRTAVFKKLSTELIQKANAVELLVPQMDTLDEDGLLAEIMVTAISQLDTINNIVKARQEKRPVKLEAI